MSKLDYIIEADNNQSIEIQIKMFSYEFSSKSNSLFVFASKLLRSFLVSGIDFEFFFEHQLKEEKPNYSIFWGI